MQNKDAVYLKSRTSAFKSLQPHCSLSLEKRERGLQVGKQRKKVTLGKLKEGYTKVTASARLEAAATVEVFK